CGDGERCDLADVLCWAADGGEKDGSCLGAQTLPSAVGAGGVAAVLGEEDADVQFVFFVFEGGEEATYAGESWASVVNEGLLLRCEVVPGGVSWDAGG